MKNYLIILANTYRYNHINSTKKQYDSLGVRGGKTYNKHNKVCPNKIYIVTNSQPKPTKTKQNQNTHSAKLFLFIFLSHRLCIVKIL